MEHIIGPSGQTDDLREPSGQTNYFRILARRKYWLIIPFLLTVLAGFAYLLTVPKTYEAETLILVQPQKVPQDYVRSIVSTDINSRLKTISQQVTSRTNLEKVIEESRLYSNPLSDLTIDEKVKLLRKNITIDVSKGTRGEDASTFTISFQGQNPETVMRVTNILASNFISENLKIRESQALGTSSFLADELESVKKSLIEKETELKEYREKNMGGLPEQLDTNLKILEGLQEQLNQLGNNLRDAENRKILLQTQIAEQSTSRAKFQANSNAQSQEVRDIESFRNELAYLKTKYTNNHPDIIRLSEIINNLETESPTDASISSLSPVSPTSSEASAQSLQLQDLELDIAGLKDEITKTQSQINWYQTRVEETPKREQELLSLNRDYDNLNEIYKSLLNRKLEAEIAVSMEKKQKGEQFKILDFAQEPSIPVSPNTKKIILLTLILGIVWGLGLAYLVEAMDPSYKNPEDLEMDLRLPVLVSMPFFQTDKERKTKKRNEILKAASVAAGFALCAIGITYASKEADVALNYVKALLYGT